MKFCRIIWKHRDELQEIRLLTSLLCNLEEKCTAMDNLEFDLSFHSDEHMFDFLDKFVISKLVKSVIKPSKLKTTLDIRGCKMNNFKKIFDTLVDSPLKENLKLEVYFPENGIGISFWKNFLEISMNEKEKHEPERVSKDLESIALVLKRIPTSFLRLYDLTYPKHFVALEALSVETIKTIELQNCDLNLDLHWFVYEKCYNSETLKVEDLSDGSLFVKNFILTELGNPDLNFKTLHAYGPKYFINTMAEIVEIMGSYCGDNQFHEANYLICSPDFTIKKEAKETVILTLHKKRQRHPSWDDSLYRMKICPNPMCDNDAEHTY